MLSAPDNKVWMTVVLEYAARGHAQAGLCIGFEQAHMCMSSGSLPKEGLEVNKYEHRHHA